MRRVLVCSALLAVCCLCEKVSVVYPKDSYLEAYSKSHSESGTIQGTKIDRDYSVSPQQSYGVSQGSNYGPPVPAYDPPVQSYGPSNYNYAPAPIPFYGPPSQPFYGMPHGMLGLLDKFKLKLDLFTLGKILLKLVIFKKIVSLIGILCLLLFIPSLKHKKKHSSNDEDEDVEMRQFKSNRGEEKLNNVTQYVLGAIESYSNKQNEQSKNCSGVYCKTEQYLKRINKKISYKKLAKLYSKDLQ
ncbi:unnamed protein product [Brassicogethes aeneus]|uniref:Uncharacterized protein n=1 Tax=Brassicogethes aeneus TaxID=1431903 RepID=A0A9P0FE14_BRAAE|nr:unnamed protein product [Brassicogethes aeneus]